MIPDDASFLKIRGPVMLGRVVPLTPDDLGVPILIHVWVENTDGTLMLYIDVGEVIGAEASSSAPGNGTSSG